jgi:L-lactate dehydrogenase (cytochrome)
MYSTRSPPCPVIYRFGGLDATREYAAVHSPSLITSTLSPAQQLGAFDTSTVTPAWTAANTAPDAPPQSPGRPVAAVALPPLETIINLHDFGPAAEKVLTPKAWAYISAGSNDQLTRDLNTSFLNRIFLRPRVMRRVGAVTTATTLFGTDLSLPVFVSPMGAALTGGPGGELDLARGAAAAGLVHVFSTPSSYPYEEILAATPARAWFQLYVNRDRAASEAALRRVERSGKVRAVLLTADLPVVSKREPDERVRMDDVITNPNTSVSVPVKGDRKGGGFARRTGSFIDPDVSWEETIPWLRRATKLPILIKGIQTAADARAAMAAGVDGIVVSNHGGRAADGAPPSILVLLELRRNCPEVFGAMPVLVDSGFRRGSDVVKALCLGASAVGIGRPFMYSLQYGVEGIEHAAAIIRDEVEMAMRLCGMADLSRDASEEFVNTGDLEYLVPRELARAKL